MAPSKARNPLAFTPWPVTIITTVVYLALIIPVLVIHHNVPPAPRTSPKGLDLTEAWRDLQTLTDGFHPYNSRHNDHVRAWLLERVDAIRRSAAAASSANKDTPDVFIFDDLTSNLTSVDSRTGVYFEGNNILVYIRGWEDKKDNWWEVPGRVPAGKGGVLVNAHYDSVSTGYGATDDGVGVVTCLQLLRYFTTPGHAPRRGLVVLFNNGEEDYLNGARAYSQHPMAKFAHTFLNLEGAGAGGRATLFRSSDTEVTQAYAKSKYPFGSVLSANGFEKGLISSQTDYVVFEGMLGLRGLDVAFMEPRARYHTDQDDARHTSIDSLWHMLSAAVATTENLVSDSSDRFDGHLRDDGLVPSGTGTRAVWFDLFGSAFVVFQLHTLFALSVTLLIVAPLVLLVTSVALSKADKMYLFRSSVSLDLTDEKIPLRGLRGFFRFPFLIGIPTAMTVGLAYMVTKVNTYITHSSAYAVWSMMISAWVFLAWFVSCVADFARPSALHRVYTWTWLFVLTWALLVVATVYENEEGLAGGYFMLFYFAGTFLATWISYLELFSLPKKSEYIGQTAQGSRRPSSYGSRPGVMSGDERHDEEDAEEDPTESTSLLRGRGRTTFANYVHVSGDHTASPNEDDEYEEHDPNVYGQEQAWSASIPRWTWFFQLLLTAPIILALLAPIALLLTSALHQTGQDGGPQLIVYLLMAGLTAALFAPMLPFIHRYTYHVPIFLFLVLVGTLIYNCVAFPFSDSNRLKLYFSQEVDLDQGNSTAYLTGMYPFVEDVVRGLPSADGHADCNGYTKKGLQCGWAGPEPHVVPFHSIGASSRPSPEWVSVNISSVNPSRRTVRFQISGQNTRACRITMDRHPITNFSVAGASPPDERFLYPARDGLKEIRLWSRTWNRTWTVDVAFSAHEQSLFGDEEEDSETRLTGQVSCLWSDDNSPGLIPALDEVRQFAPAWVAVSKLTDGLVEGYRKFELEVGS
ncbi:Peptidase M28 [Penicillium capsulatum]|uniref:Peptide hydrolase n=1 Tax=Penicillium capsulatum TaxID=69766 RepID=A0A9W9IT48_9EURO|nr:Peptidase M28 [Penicillium capsulatum]KAJ6129786.1 Peptidase M28 [Penicillium capsulatum]